tara:strand:- start:1428 stop:1676 length:249 start_codon:yes stop_codon:yes gene_type:complete
MITSSDIVMVGLAILIGFINEKTGPQAYKIKGQLVYVYSKYQCPSYCDVHHMHYVSEDSIDKHSQKINKKKLEELKVEYGYR